MPDEKETERQVPDMSQIENVDGVIRVLFGVPPEGDKLSFTKTKRGSLYHRSWTQSGKFWQ